MTVGDLKAFMENHPPEYDSLVLKYKAAIDRRIEINKRAQALQGQLEAARTDYVRALGVEEGLRDAVMDVSDLVKAKAEQPEEAP